jgi:transposase-like protein
MSEQRKQYSPQEKVSILKRHLVEGVPVSDLCDQHGIHPTVFYRWQKVFFENGVGAFAHQQAAAEKYLEKKIAALEAKLSQKNEVLSEVMEEHVRLKKSLGER